ncbi:porin [Erwinia sp. S63]|uniref:porin n=1 Tax=Erwinia sp. S63 TaxID=2769341 RepID=UPI00190BDE95|nr:porin [Erwinia sp. S63]
MDYGRNYSVIYDLASVTDIPVIFDNVTFSNTDNFMTGRGNGFLTYYPVPPARRLKCQHL